MREYGVRIAENGYEVIPISPGEKYPAGAGMKNWQKFDGSPDGIHDYLAQGWGTYGIGLKCRRSPGVDMDIVDLGVLDEVKEIVTRIAGMSPLRRVGFAPKELWVYRMPEGETWPKVDTGEWFDQQGRKAKCEILADGQQFVAAHIHPDTNKPYRWIGEGSPASVPLNDLPELTHEQAEQIRDEVLKVFLGHGWVKKTKSAISRLTNPLDPDDDDPFAGYRQKTQISDEELERKLFSIEDNTDHDTWFQIGMALYHQYDGSQQGFDLWDRWSQSADNYDFAALEKRWPTFDNKDRSHMPMTARIILQLAKQKAEVETKEVVKDFLLRILNSGDVDSLVEVCDEIKVTELPSHIRELITGKVKSRWKDITQENPRIGFVRELIRYESKETISAPPWVKPWVYCGQTDIMFNSHNRTEFARPAFNVAFAKYMMTPTERLEGKAAPEIMPVDACVNLYQIPTVYNRMFMPGQGPLYTMGGIDYANLYTEEGIPELPDDLSPVEQEAIDIFCGHFEHLIANEADRTTYLDFLTYVVQNPGKRINWAILLQGAEGDGKSYFISMMKAVMGPSNVNMVAGKALEEKYNPWAEGSCICFIEDVRLHGNNRFDAINTLKPILTNPSVSIRRMNTNLYEVVNTVSYVLTANAKDAMPVGEEDSRIFPIFTRFQRAEAIDAFKRENPFYYDRLYATVEFAGAIRKFLLLRQTSPSFNPKARAPKSSHRAEMIMLNQSEEQIALADTLEESTQVDYSRFLLDSGKLADHFMGTDALPPRGKALNRLLSESGYTLLGRFRVNGEKRQYWTQRPECWPHGEEKCGDAVREYLDPDGL